MWSLLCSIGTRITLCKRHLCTWKSWVQLQSLDWQLRTLTISTVSMTMVPGLICSDGWNLAFMSSSNSTCCISHSTAQLMTGWTSLRRRSAIVIQCSLWCIQECTIQTSAEGSSLWQDFCWHSAHSERGFNWCCCWTWHCWCTCHASSWGANACTFCWGGNVWWLFHQLCGCSWGDADVDTSTIGCSTIHCSRPPSQHCHSRLLFQCPCWWGESTDVVVKHDHCSNSWCNFQLSEPEHVPSCVPPRTDTMSDDDPISDISLRMDVISDDDPCSKVNAVRDNLPSSVAPHAVTSVDSNDDSATDLSATCVDAALASSFGSACVTDPNIAASMFDWSSPDDTMSSDDDDSTDDEPLMRLRSNMPSMIVATVQSVTITDAAAATMKPTAAVVKVMAGGRKEWSMHSQFCWLFDWHADLLLPAVPVQNQLLCCQSSADSSASSIQRENFDTALPCDWVTGNHWPCADRFGFKFCSCWCDCCCSFRCCRCHWAHCCWLWSTALPDQMPLSGSICNLFAAQLVLSIFCLLSKCCQDGSAIWLTHGCWINICDSASSCKQSDWSCCKIWGACKSWCWCQLWHWCCFIMGHCCSCNCHDDIWEDDVCALWCGSCWQASLHAHWRNASSANILFACQCWWHWCMSPDSLCNWEWFGCCLLLWCPWGWWHTCQQTWNFCQPFEMVDSLIWICEQSFVSWWWCSCWLVWCTYLIWLSCFASWLSIVLHATWWLWDWDCIWAWQARATFVWCSKHKQVCIEWWQQQWCRHGNQNLLWFWGCPAANHWQLLCPLCICSTVWHPSVWEQHWSRTFG